MLMKDLKQLFNILSIKIVSWTCCVTHSFGNELHRFGNEYKNAKVIAPTDESGIDVMKPKHGIELDWMEKSTKWKEKSALLQAFLYWKKGHYFAHGILLPMYSCWGLMNKMRIRITKLWKPWDFLTLCLCKLELLGEIEYVTAFAISHW